MINQGSNQHGWLLFLFLLTQLQLGNAQTDDCPHYFSGSSVYSSIQTDSTIWFATENKLVEYYPDTDSMVYFSLPDYPELFDYVKAKFHLDKQKTLWCTTNKLFRFDGNNWIREGSFIQYNLQIIGSDSLTGIWLIEGDTLIHYDANREMEITRIGSSFAMDGAFITRSGKIWAYNSNGIFHPDESKMYKPFEDDTARFVVNINYVYLDPEDQIHMSAMYTSDTLNPWQISNCWVQFNEGVFTIKRDNFDYKMMISNGSGDRSFANYDKVYLQSDSTWSMVDYPHPVLSFITIDSTLWLGTDNGLIQLKDTFHKNSKRFGNALFKNHNFKAMTYGIGGLWVASEKDRPVFLGDGVWSEDSSGWKYLPTRIEGILQGRLYMYLADYNYLYKTNKNTWQRYEVDLYLGNVSMTMAGNGHVFVSSQYRYVYEFDGQSFKKHQLKFGSVNSDFKALATDNNGRVWVGGENKVYVLNGRNWEPLEFPQSMDKGFRISRLFFDHNNHLWIGCSSEEFILEYDGSKFYQHFRQKSNGSYYKLGVKDIAEDANSNLLISCYQDGLYKYDGSNWTLYDTILDKYSMGSVSHIQPGNDGVWLKLKEGLFHMKDCSEEKEVTFFKKEFSSVRPSESIGIQIGPNPFNDNIGIYRSESSNTVHEVIIYDITGRIQYQRNFEDVDETYPIIIQLNQNIPCGSYFMRIVTSKGIQYKKLIRSEG